MIHGSSAMRGSTLPTPSSCGRRVRRAARGININLMKCGGPSAALTIHDRAHADGLSLMLGCNHETRVSIAAAPQCGGSFPLFRAA